MSSLSKDSFRYFFRIKDWMPTKSNLVQAFKCIQIEERERIERFHFKEDFKAALIGRLLLRKIVHQRFNLNNQKIKLERTKHNRPILSNENENDSIDDQIFDQKVSGSYSNNFDFNVSHQGDYCVAVGDNVEQIGIDIMKIEKRSNRPLDEYFKLMNRNFTENEWNFINNGQLDHERIKRFIRLWTLKESFVKAQGCGLTINLLSIDFNCKTNDLELNKITSNTTLKLNGKLQSDWTFIEYLLDDYHCVSIAINKSNHLENECLNEIKFDELINGLESLDDKVNVTKLWSTYCDKKVREDM